MDCIAAIATGAAATAIGIVRISGEGCFALCDAVFHPYSGKKLSECTPRSMVYGSVLDRSGGVLDRALAVRFPAPHSYTGEDCAEVHCHGSPVVLQELLAALFQQGARQALPGEFTKRAFLNGCMDLTQAEAVVDLIDAETVAAAGSAAAQLGGSLRREFEEVTEGLLDVASRFYAVVDYPDEDIPDIHPEEVRDTLQQAQTQLERLLGSFQRGRVLKQGVRTAIIGRPNAGKSSLLNALAGYDRAIVTEVPGTTRDTVEESVLCGGVLLRLIDTAGLRKTEDRIERLGVERSRAAVDSADLILLLRDSTEGMQETDSPAAREAPAADGAALQEDRDILHLAAASGKPWIALASKCDLSGMCAFSPEVPQKKQGEEVEGDGEAVSPPAACLCISSVTGQGLEELEAVIARLFPPDAVPGRLLTNPRQADAVGRALEAVRRALEALASGLTPDAAVTDVEEALDALGEITGRTARETIVEEIFSRFCVGK